MKVTVGRALVMRKRLAEKIRRTEEMIAQYNSIVKGNTRPIEVDEEFVNRGLLVADLIDLKCAISSASEPVREKILTLAELKAEITFYAGLNCAEGIQTPEWRSEAPVEREAVASTTGVAGRIEELEGDIDQLQAELDAFNAKTKIEVPG